MRRTLVISAFVAATTAFPLLASPASAGRVRPEYQTSWGKAGVSLEEYWIDASECGHTAAATDLSGTAPAEALVLASRMITNQNGYDDVERALRLAPPDVQWNRAGTIMRHELERCLTDRGYTRFRLTKGQAHQLKTLAVGSLERRKYLHKLASDPAVLAGQALEDS
uniref:hypothetical protein n=1 Tax=Altererythrobacter segetis TaxID=1104773 RepID=UPI0014075537|nr:hypothetical protein [Altererythrobacter segetis]